MGKTLKPLIIGIIIGVVGLYAYQNPEIRSQISDFVGEVLNSVSEVPAPASTPPAMVALPEPSATPAQMASTQVTPIPTATLSPSPTETPEPEQLPTATPTLTPMPTPVPASYSIEVVSMKALEDGKVDFLLEVRNDQILDDEIVQLQMSVDDGAPELVNIIANLPPGQSASFAFARSFDPGSYAIKFSVGDSHTTVNVNIEPEDVTVFTPTPQPTVTATPTIIPTPMPTNTPVPANTPMPTITPLPTDTSVPVNTATPIPAPETAVSPDLRHLEEKTYMLELINAERAKAGLGSVVLGDNIAAQLHAETALENCFASHWGIDGLKPYMRYSLAGGYQSNGENGSGSDYCIKASDGYRAIRSINAEIREAMEGWMDSPGHRRNILGKWHKKVNIGLAWDRYNFLAYQHFEGDYVEYDELPSIESGVLRISGRTKNGARVSGDRDLGVQIYYDQPPHSLTRGQVTRTYCYDGGRQIGALRKPLTGGWYYEEEEFTKSYRACPDPYDVPVDAPAPRSHHEANRFWQAGLRFESRASGNSTRIAVDYGIGMDDRRSYIRCMGGLGRPVSRIWRWSLYNPSMGKSRRRARGYFGVLNIPRGDDAGYVHIWRTVNTARPKRRINRLQCSWSRGLLCCTA
ncbi:MAG: hypothetical protein F4Z35_04165 [Dehalococcoidia bacterium]|nr:hypothetical protein [Dehalococcoidia bacterium]